MYRIQLAAILPAGLTQPASLQEKGIGESETDDADNSSSNNNKEQLTLDILKSLKIPLPLPPSMHRFRICVGFV